MDEKQMLQPMGYTYDSIYHSIAATAYLAMPCTSPYADAGGPGYGVYIA